MLIVIAVANTRRMRKFIRGFLMERDHSELTDPIDATEQPDPLRIMGTLWGRPTLNAARTIAVFTCRSVEITAADQERLRQLVIRFVNIRGFVQQPNESAHDFDDRWRAALGGFVPFVPVATRRRKAPSTSSRRGKDGRARKRQR